MKGEVNGEIQDLQWSEAHSGELKMTSTEWKLQWKLKLIDSVR